MSSVMLVPQTNVTGPWYCSQAGEDTKAVASGKGMLHTLMIANANAAVRYAYVFDSASASGTQIAGPFPVPASGAIQVPLPYGVPFSTGLFVALSSTIATYTASAGTDGRFTVGWAKRASL